MINIENKSHPQLGESFSTQEEFFETIRQYGFSQGFTIRYSKVDNRNKEKEIRKRTILYLREGIPVAKKDYDKPKQQRELKRCRCDVSQIISILKEEFSEKITWIYDDIYNFIYRTQELNNEKFDASEFIQTLKLMQEENPEFKFSYMVNFETNRLKHSNFIKQFYKYLEECDQITFNELWNSLKNEYPKAVAYLVQMEKTVNK
ncbi:8512_t:CDS:2 [Scutellospora calospora]|uniref:8512_t:CDS:1 n=1 Tax=Scutellospora calospora TaxID=85575 RepID=A0ACA9M3M7_9GLOM|nr:8512_t:CDS:2 [Scutellospora calospora]